MKYLFVAVLLLTFVCIYLAVLLLMNHRKEDELAALIEKYLTDGKKIEYSVRSDRFSRLYNDICDMCDTLEVQKQNNQRDNIKNAQFVADISHQLKTPLSGIKLYAEMKQAEAPTENGEKELQLIAKMENLIYRLLRLEKIKTDSYVMDFRFFDVSEIANEVIDEFRPLFPEKQYSVIGNSKLRLDKAWFSEGIGNLVKNASEHTAENGRVEILIEDSEKSTTVTVSDNGGGIPENEIPELFERFHRIQNAKPNSTGLGLAITSAIVEKHHGTIYAENKNGGLNIIMCFPHIDGMEKL